MRRCQIVVGAALVAGGCPQESADEPSAGSTTREGPMTPVGEEVGSSSSGGGPADPDPDPDPDAVTVTHAFGPISMGAQQDDAEGCASWTLHNEKALYVNATTMSNEGLFHHSNWFVVPEDVYGGLDGYWRCDDRGFTEIDAAQAGTVLFAQSTQSYVEEQRLSAGAVIKIPPYSRIVAGLHTLNTAPRDAASSLYLTLELLHPADVTAVVTPLSMRYKDLAIPAQSESRFTADCNLAIPYSAITFKPLALRLHYILPHYHYLGNFFDVTVVGGLLDGQSVYSLDGFNGEANGLTFDEPLDLPGATGLKMTCGYDNWRTEEVGWGNGDGEMCVMLALVESDMVIGASVDLGDHVVGVEDGIEMHEGTCLGIAVPKTPGQDPPTDEEKSGELYLPPTPPGDHDVPPVPECDDADRLAAPEAPVSLSSLRDTVFTPTCTFSACHGQAAAAGLDLSAPGLHARLLDHNLQLDPGMPLVSPGDPAQSWLYQIVSRCDPELSNGAVVNHMPLNAPILIDDELVAKLRAWIEAGAPDD